MLATQPQYIKRKTHPLGNHSAHQGDAEPIEVTKVEHFKLYLLKAAEIDYCGDTNFCETEYCKKALASIGVTSLNGFKMEVKFTDAFTASERLEIFDFIAELRKSYEDDYSLANLFAMLTAFQISAGGYDFAFLNMIVPALQQAISHDMEFDGESYINTNSIGSKISSCSKRLEKLYAASTPEEAQSYAAVKNDAKKAYLKFSLKHHPDKSAKPKEEAEKTFKEGATIYKEWCDLKEKVDSARVNYYLSIFQEKLADAYENVIRYAGISQAEYNNLLDPRGVYLSSSPSDTAKQEALLKKRVQQCVQILGDLSQEPEYRNGKVIAALLLVVNADNQVGSSRTQKILRKPRLITQEDYERDPHAVIENFIKKEALTPIAYGTFIEQFLRDITEHLKTAKQQELSDDLNPFTIYKKQLAKEKLAQHSYANFMKTRVINSKERCDEFNKRCEALCDGINTTFKNIYKLQCSSEAVAKHVEESRKALQHAVGKENLKLLLVLSRVGFATAALFAMEMPVYAIAGSSGFAIAIAAQLYYSKDYKEQNKHLGVTYKSSMKNMICDAGMDTGLAASCSSMYSYFAAAGTIMQILFDIPAYGPIIATRIALKYAPNKIVLAPVLIDAATIALHSLYTKICTSQTLNPKYFFNEGPDKEYVLSDKPKVQPEASVPRDYLASVRFFERPEKITKPLFYFIHIIATIAMWSAAFAEGRFEKNGFFSNDIRNLMPFLKAHKAEVGLTVLGTSIAYGLLGVISPIMEQLGYDRKECEKYKSSGPFFRSGALLVFPLHLLADNHYGRYTMLENNAGLFNLGALPLSYKICGIALAVEALIITATNAVSKVGHGTGIVEFYSQL